MNEKISYLTLEKTKTLKQRSNWFNTYRCVCGNEVVAPACKVKSLHTTSCGCLSKRLAYELNGSHYLTSHPLYKVWANMRKRCYYESDKAYFNYGGRGVIVCDEWRKDFKPFYDWCISNGWKRGLQIDKDIKGDGLLYSPETCSIITQKLNCNNRRSNRFIEYKGEKKTVAQWADQYNILATSFLKRIDRGWDFDKAANTPVKKNGPIKRVLCVDTGEIFKSATEAASKKGLLQGSITAVIRGERNHTGGLRFKHLI